MNSRVHELDLRMTIHAIDQPRFSELQRSIEDQFITGVLESLERDVHTRFGSEAILRVQHLNVHWSIDRQQLQDSQYIERLGQELAEEFHLVLNQRSAAQQMRPIKSQSVVLFENQAHQWAAWLSDLQNARDSWFYQQTYKQQDVWSLVLNAGQSELMRTVDYLERMGTLKPLIKRLDRHQARQALALLPLDQWPQSVVPILEAKQARATSVDDSSTQTSSHQSNAHVATEPAEVNTKHLQQQSSEDKTPGLRQPVRDDKDKSQHTRSLHASKTVQQKTEAHAYDKQAIDKTIDHHSPSPNLTTAIETAAGSKYIGAADLDASNAMQPPIDKLSIHPVMRPGSLQEKKTEQSNEVTPSEKIGCDSTQAGLGVSQLSVESAGGHSCMPDLAIEKARDYVETDFAGLFYLLNPIIELDMPEHLWCAGIIEGDFMCHMCRMLLGEQGANDPAPAVLTGKLDADDPPLAVIPDWASTEIQSKSLQSLRDTYRRRGYNISSTDLRTELEESAAIMVSRLQQNIHDPVTAHLISHCAAVAVHAFFMRLQQRFDRDSFLGMVQVPGRIERENNDIRICMPMGSIDMRIRRAALDVNPGYLPWLRCKLEFDYEENG